MRSRHYGLILCLLVLALSAEVNGTTYYVGDSVNVTTSGTPSDANNGLSWSAPWASIGKVNASIAGGDTVYFATGLWRNQQLIPKNGTSADRSCFADSAFADTNGAGDYHFAKIYGSVSVGTWAQIGATNTYRTTTKGYTGFFAGFQGDSVLWLQQDSASVNAPGECWSSGTSIIAYVHNIGSAGYDPDAYQMEFSQLSGGPLVYCLAYGDHTTFYGLEFKYNHSHLMLWGGGGGSDIDSIFVDHCKMSCVYYNGGSNPSCIFSYNMGSPSHDYTRVRACSLGNVWAYTYPDVYWDDDGAHGTGTCYYRTQHSVIESCYVYGIFTFAGLYLKNDGSAVVNDNVFRYNDIANTRGLGLQIYNYISGADVYGNVFREIGTPLRINMSSCDTCGRITITNNTFYNCDYTYTHRNLYSEGYAQKNITVKYNVSFDDDDLEVWLRYEDSNQTNGWFVDSNMYYAGGTLTRSTGSIYESGDADYKTFTVSEWNNTLHHDEHSSWSTYPGFSDTAGGDFSRPSASNEMNATYGGKTWTIYGAIQGSPSPPAGNGNKKMPRIK